MKTIGAKELRLNLTRVLDRVIAGEDIIVKHRFKQPVYLQSSRVSSSSDRSRLRGLASFDVAPKKPSPFDKHKTIKELYRESIAKKYKI